MKRKLSQRMATGLLCLSAVLLSFMPGCSKGEDAAAGEAGNGPEAQAGAGVKVTFFNVGKGDAILIETAEHTMLIDAGYDDTSAVLLDYMEEQKIHSLDYLVITHFDKDHVGGADHIIRAVDTEVVLQPDYESDSGQYQEYVEAMAEEEILPVPVTETMKLSLDEAEFLIYPPQQESYEEKDNDFSLVISMSCGETDFLFAGDCEKERLKELLNQKEFSLSHEVLKVPHHGRKEKNSEEFLLAVCPEAAVITSSEEKPADEEVCRMLEGMKTAVYFTENGTVTCLSDGKNLQFVQE